MAYLLWHQALAVVLALAQDRLLSTAFFVAVFDLLALAFFLTGIIALVKIRQRLLLTDRPMVGDRRSKVSLATPFFVVAPLFFLLLAWFGAAGGLSLWLSTSSGAPLVTATPVQTRLTVIPTQPQVTVTPTVPPDIVHQGTDTISVGHQFNFDAGVLTDTGGDVLWERVNDGYRMTAQGAAFLANTGTGTNAQFSQMSCAKLTGLFSGTGPVSNTLNSLAAEDIFAVMTNERHYTKVFVQSYGDTLHLQWVTYRCPGASS